ncbi:MBL fold metallo-hydrolase [Kineococcus rubinsiae]|uniref:MBL fold metallo-hydrolase n=1 Tax=Kineococcus rubinsiae TaxID=2609562 RepID=UPI00142F4FD7|nr:MBL fold metallo-hydrolase [Kineococcus rubinsiae]
MAKATVHTLLQGYQVESTVGDIAFCSVNLIEAPDGAGGVTRIVVDTGHFGRGVVLRQALAARGLTASDIDVLLLTHAHWDHVQGIQYFDNAVVLAHPKELDYISNPHGGDHATPAWTKAVLDRYDIRSVTEGHDLAPGVSVVEAAGHSPGTIAASVDTDDGVVVVTGDAIQNAMVAQQRRNALVFWNEEQANRSVGKLVDLSDVVRPGHDQPFRLSATGEVEYLEEFSFGLRRVLPDTPGLTFDLQPELTPVISEAPPGWMD